MAKTLVEPFKTEFSREKKIGYKIAKYQQLFPTKIGIYQ